MDLASGNIFIRPMEFAKAGDIVDGHTHNFDHTTYVVRGAVRIEQLDEMGNVLRAVDKAAVDGHNWVLIKASVVHRITALSDNTLAHCIYAHREPQGEVVQEANGWLEAYQ